MALAAARAAARPASCKTSRRFNMAEAVRSVIARLLARNRPLAQDIAAHSNRRFSKARRDFVAASAAWRSLIALICGGREADFSPLREFAARRYLPHDCIAAQDARNDAASRTPLPRHRARRRRGHAHAIRPAESAAQDRRALDARPCARRPCAGRARMRSPSWSGRVATMSPPRRAPPRPTPQIFVQAERLGTAHAVLAAREAIARGLSTTFWSLFADTPLVRPETFAHLRESAGRGRRRRRRSASSPPIPTGYGRLLTDDDGALLAIREHKDASAAERAIGALQRRPDGARRRARARAAGRASATTTPRRNFI